MKNKSYFYTFIGPKNTTSVNIKNIQAVHWDRKILKVSLAQGYVELTGVSQEEVDRFLEYLKNY